MKRGLLIVCILLAIVLCISFGYYVWALAPISTEDKEINFIIAPGTSKTEIAKNLEKAGLIRSEYVLDVYLAFTKPNIQAGEYILTPNMTPKEMIEKFSKGDVKINSITVTLVEGKRITDYAKTLEEKFDFTASDFLAEVNDHEFLKTLVESEEYWFLKDVILNEDLYYPLEGYLYPNTYEFLETVTPKEIITTLLNQTKKELEPYKEEILNSGKSYHDLLTMASIVEIEANNKSDREKASQVFYTRIASNDTLGSDVTAFYGARKEMGHDAETWSVLNNVNPYNTRLQDGSMNGKLPIGAVSNPGIESILASLHPSDTNYYFFVANVCTGEVFFQNTSEEFMRKCEELRNICSQN